MARQVHLLYVRVPAAYDYEKDMPSSYNPACMGFILAKRRSHRHRPEFNGLFEYEEYISLKRIDDANTEIV